MCFVFSNDPCYLFIKRLMISESRRKIRKPNLRMEYVCRKKKCLNDYNDYFKNLRICDFNR